MNTTKQRIAGLVGTTAMATVLGLTAVAPANAASATPSSVISSVTTTNAACVEAVTEAQQRGETSVTLDSCTSTVTLTASEEETVSPADLAQAARSLSPASFAQLRVAATAGAVKKKNYSQGFNNITDKQSQSGTFYYDGSRAWVTANYRGHQGTHNCDVNWSVGYVVEEKACSESGTNAQRDLYVKWHFSAIPSGGLVNWDESHTMHVNKTGRIWQ